jgi:membrane protein DedA with SNARE-associated domain
VETVRALLLDMGYLAVFLGPLLENAGLPVPGDSALFWTAFLAASGHFRLELLIALAIAGAIGGDNAGYVAGRRGGRPLIERWRGRLPWMGTALGRTETFFATHGGKTIFFARFIPGLRVWAALVAGASLMPWRRFLWFNCLGAVAWAGVTAGLGYGLGHRVAWVQQVTENVWLAGAAGLAVLAAIIYAQHRLARRLGA